MTRRVVSAKLVDQWFGPDRYIDSEPKHVQRAAIMDGKVFVPVGLFFEDEPRAALLIMEHGSDGMIDSSGHFYASTPDMVAALSHAMLVTVDDHKISFFRHAIVSVGDIERTVRALFYEQVN